MNKKYKLIAHRGYHNQTIKENTYLAIKKALNHKDITGVEFDIRLTKDNQIVIIHDHNIQRISNGFLTVEQSTLKDLQKYNYGSQSTPTTLTTLTKILDLNPSKLLLIEIKCHHNEKKFAKTISQTLQNYPHLNIYLISFDQKVLKYLQKLNYPQIPISITKPSFYQKQIIIPYHLSKKIKKNHHQVFLYTLKNYQDILNINEPSYYYICDNLDNILKNL